MSKPAGTKSISYVKEQKEFNLLSNNKQFLSKIILSDKIQITLLEQDSIFPIYFNADLTLQILIKINKIFKI